MRNTLTRKSAVFVVLLALLTIGLAAPATASSSGEPFEGVAIADFETLDEGELTVDGTKLHVRKASLEYATVYAFGTNPIERVKYVINYSVDLTTGEGVIWGKWRSLDPKGLRGIHIGTVSNFIGPDNFSFDSYAIGRGHGLVMVYNSVSDTAGAVAHLTGLVFP
ncbi:MAG: hypothetical protein QNJ88_16975 [Acidimicrobiia bacterium]|nr:hypothetical protein [Acidimicrobiia bacterium]